MLIIDAASSIETKKVFPPSGFELQSPAWNAEAIPLHYRTMNKNNLLIYPVDNAFHCFDSFNLNKESINWKLGIGLKYFFCYFTSKSLFEMQCLIHLFWCIPHNLVFVLLSHEKEIFFSNKLKYNKLQLTTTLRKCR